jgi:multisubunit Na+/H+ antiporter MnhF subunit
MMNDMNAWLWAAFALLFSFIPCLIVCNRGDLGARVVGLETAGILVTLELLCLSQGFSHPSFYDLPLTLAFLSLGGGLVFARFIQRWL